MLDFSKYRGISKAQVNNIEVLKEDKLLRFNITSN